MLEHYNIMNESKASDHSNKLSTSRVRIMHIVSFLVKSKEFRIDLTGPEHVLQAQAIMTYSLQNN
jgi:hypothetical protein